MNYKLEKITCDFYEDLYELLEKRDETINISHKKMPTYEEHCDFWRNCTYKYARAIVVDGEFAGYTYLTNSNEIGIFVKEEFQGKGIAKNVITEIIKQFKGLRNKRFLANINPKNIKSQKLFESLGFKPCQITYEFL